MASPSIQTAEVAERPAEQAEQPEIRRFVSPRPVPKDAPWTIKLLCGIPS